MNVLMSCTHNAYRIKVNANSGRSSSAGGPEKLKDEVLISLFSVEGGLGQNSNRITDVKDRWVNSHV